MRTTRIGLVIAGVLGLADLSMLIPGEDGPPLAIALGVAALGVITLVSLPFGWRGSRVALAVVIVTRLVSAVAAVPALFIPELPLPLRLWVAAGVVLTLLAVGLISTGLFRREKTGAVRP